MRILKLSHCAENVKGDALVVFNIQFVAKYRKIEGEPFGDIEKIFENLTAPKKLKGSPFLHFRQFLHFSAIRDCSKFSFSTAC